MLGETLANFELAHRMIKEAIQVYNEERPHLSLNFATPAERQAA